LRDVSIVLEVGFSQTAENIESLANDYRHESYVKGVITVDIDTTEPVITVEYLTLLHLPYYTNDQN
jgi:hypothetical protein